MKNLSKLIARFARFGVLHREAVKNDMEAVERLARKGFVRRILKSGRVFYELTEKSLPLLEHHRRRLGEEAMLLAEIEKGSPFYSALEGDLRFLDEADPRASDFTFLGDWRIFRPTVPAQLELAKLRFYRDRVPARHRQRRAA